jgi:hypothetical protein
MAIKRTHKATIGSISEGTLRTEDLVSAFSYELARLTNGSPDAHEKAVLQSVETWETEDADYREEMEGCEIVQDLIDALNQYAPTCCYFGTNEGDGASFGFWPCMEAVDELPRVSDPADVEKHLGEECVFVNDHGNVTLYNADGSVAWDCV